MADPVRRKVYAYELEMAYVLGNRMILGFDTEFLKEALEHIISLTSDKKEESKKDEWFFYLDHVEESKDKQFLYGWFKGARIGTKIPLIMQGTFQERDNPKHRNEGERMKTHFVLRMKDGLFLLESFFGNVVTPRRIEEYIQNRYSETFEREKIHHITLKSLLNPNFIQKINDFQTIKFARIKVMVEPGRYGQNEAVSTMQRQAEPTLANYAMLQIGIDRKRYGMNKDAIVAWIRDKLSDRQHILAARIEGKMAGEDSHIDLKGIEERYTCKVQRNNFGDVLSEDVLKHMIEIGRSRKRIR